MPVILLHRFTRDLIGSRRSTGVRNASLKRQRDGKEARMR